MHLVPALCPQCGGALDVDPNQEAAVCKFCGTPFITEKAIQNYNVTNVTNNVTNVTNNVTNVSNINAQEVNLQAGPTAQQLLDNIKALTKRGNSSKVRETKDELEKKFPSDYRVDEAELFLAIVDWKQYRKGDLAEVRKKLESPWSYFVSGRGGRVLQELFKTVTEANAEVAQGYYRDFTQEVNEMLEPYCGQRFTGGIPFVKLIFLDGIDFDLYLKNTTIHESTGFDYTTLKPIYDSQTKAERNGEWEILQGNLKEAEACDWSDIDEVYIIWLIHKLENCDFETYKSEPDIYAPFVKTIEKHLSPEGLERLTKERAEEEFKKKTELYEKAYKVNEEKWEDYLSLLKSGKVGDAYKQLQYIATLKQYINASAELAMFKKKLVGAKYLGDISSLTLEGLIERSLNDAGIKKP